MTRKSLLSGPKESVGWPERVCWVAQKRLLGGPKGSVGWRVAQPSLPPPPEKEMSPPAPLRRQQTRCPSQRDVSSTTSNSHCVNPGLVSRVLWGSKVDSVTGIISTQVPSQTPTRQPNTDTGSNTSHTPLSLHISWCKHRGMQRPGCSISCSNQMNRKVCHR